jgi:hypothetical protein
MGMIFALSGYVVLMRLPEDYFLRAEQNAVEKGNRPPGHIFSLVLRNLVGVVIIVVGGILSLPLVPGPGLILVILGLSLTSFPGKQTLKMKLLRAPLALGTVNWLRSKGGRPALLLPERSGRPC